MLIQEKWQLSFLKLNCGFSEILHLTLQKLPGNSVFRSGQEQQE
jgi:hypothetical protein